MRYHFSIHNLHTTHLDQLDLIARKCFKMWLNIPARGATDAGIFHPYLLNVIKQPSQLYLEGHISNYTLMRMKGDKVVNAALDREPRWKQKSSIYNCAVQQ